MWDYRLCRKTHDDGHGGKIVSYGIHEAFYNEDGSLWAVTENEVTVGFVELDIDDGNAAKSAKWIFDKMNLALTKPVLDLDTIEFSDRRDDSSESGE